MTTPIRGLGTLQVQRADTTLGVTQGQQKELARHPTNNIVIGAQQAKDVRLHASVTQKNMDVPARTLRANQSEQVKNFDNQGLPLFVDDDSAAQEEQRAGPSMRPKDSPTPTSSSPLGRAESREFRHAVFQPKGASGFSSAQLSLSRGAQLVQALMQTPALYPVQHQTLGVDRALFVHAVMMLRGAAQPEQSSNTLAAHSQTKTGVSVASQPGLAPGAVFPTSSSLSGALAATLYQAVAGTGLFYESHIARALRGEPHLWFLIRQQPQAQISHESSGRVQVELPLRGSRSEVTIPEPAAQMVRQQLEAFSQQHIGWQGMVWPGATLQWDISPIPFFVMPEATPEKDPRSTKEQKQHQGNDNIDESADHSWSSRLRLKTPSLGDIEARIRIVGNELFVSLSPSENVDFFASSLALLAQRLEHTGLEVKSLTLDSTHRKERV